VGDGGCEVSMLLSVKLGRIVEYWNIDERPRFLQGGQSGTDVARCVQRP
jgi:hypothetical protein